MRHSSVDESLVKNPVCPLYLPTPGGFEEEKDEQEDEQEDEPEDEYEDELEDSRYMREDGLYGQEGEFEEVEEAREVKTRASP